jgi:hypothetical protein
MLVEVLRSKSDDSYSPKIAEDGMLLTCIIGASNDYNSGCNSRLIEEDLPRGMATKGYASHEM